MIAKGPSQELVNVRQDGYLLCIAEKNVTKVKSNGCVLDAFRVELSLISYKFQVCNNFFGFEKITFKN